MLSSEPAAVAGDSSLECGLPDRTGRLESRTWRVLTFATLMAVALGINIGHIWRYTELSPVDEAQHLDSLIRIPRGDLIGSGERMGQETLRIETCHRIDAEFDVKVPPCDPDSPPLDATIFQEQGYNTAFIHPPTYYFVDGVLARVVDFVLPGEHDLLTTGRLAGLIWVVGAVAFLWLLLDEVGAGTLSRAALIILAVTAPTVLLGTATVNLDGTALATGAAVLWSVLRWERRRAPAWLPILFAAVAAATKVTNLVGVGVVVVYLIARAVLRSRRPAGEEGGARWSAAAVTTRFWAPGSAARRNITMVVGLVVAVGAVSLAWFVGQHILEVAPPSTVPMVYRYYFDSFPFSQWASSWHQTVSPFYGTYVPPFLHNRSVDVSAGVVDLLLVAGPVAGTVLARRGTRARALGGSAIGLMPLIGPTLVLFNAVVQGLYVVIPSRYGLSLVPALLAASVPALRWKVPLGIATAVAAVALLGVSAGIMWPAA